MKMFEAELKVQSKVDMTCDPCISTWTIMDKYYFVKCEWCEEILGVLLLESKLCSSHMPSFNRNVQTF